MLIKSVKIYGFGKHIRKEFTFRNGFNVICGNDEDGKNTLFAFIRAMLYGLDGREEENARKKYVPRERLDDMGKTVRFGGEMVFESHGTVYQEVCIWGASKREDTRSLNEFYTGRPVRLHPNGTVGEQILRFNASAFDAAVFAAQPGAISDTESGEEGIAVARLSAVTGFGENRPNGAAADRILKEKMDALKAPRGKSGELDQLVIKKLNMQNELTRLSDTDNKITAQKEKLDELLRSRDALLRSEADYNRMLRLAQSAKLLLTKDKMMTVFSSVDGICTELEECRRFAAQSEQKRVSPGKLITGIVLLLTAVAGFLLAFLYKGFSAPVRYALIAGGGLAAVAALLLIPGSFVKKRDMVRGGVKIDVEKRMEELEETLSQKEVLIQSYLGSATLEEMEDSWRKSEELLKSSTEEERRYVTSRPSGGFEEALAEIREKLEPVVAQIGSVQAEIERLRASVTVSFSEAAGMLHGIDEEIDRVSDRYKAYELAHLALTESMAPFRETLCSRLCEETERIFSAVTGTHISVRIAEDFTVYASGDGLQTENAAAGQVYLALRLAAAMLLLPEEGCMLIFDDSFAREGGDTLTADALAFFTAYANQEAEENGAGDLSEKQMIQVLFAVPGKTEVAADKKIQVLSLTEEGISE